MTIDKPEIGDLEWGGTLNSVLDELANKETIDGSQTKATQAYEAAVEYADARVGEITVDVTGATAAAQAAATAASASASSAGAAQTSAASAAATASDDASDAASSAAAAANSAATTAAALSSKQDISTLSTDVAAHVSDATALDVAVAAKIAASFVAQVGFNPKSYGAVGNGSHNDTAGIAAAVSAAAAAISAGVAGAKIVFPAGEFVVDDTLALTQFSGSIEGQGVGNPPTYTASPGNGTVIRWTGPNTKSMFKLRNYANVDITGIRFEGNDTTPPTALIESNSVSGDGAGTGSYLRISKCQFGKSTWSTQGTNKGAAAVGILFSGDNVNNDTFAIRDSQIAGCAIGVSIPNTQSTWGMTDNLLITGSTTAGVKTSAALLMVNPQFDNCAIDLQADSTAAVTSMGWGSERSGRIIDVTGLGRVNVYGGKWLLSSPMTGSTDRFISMPFATANAGVFLHDVNINNTLGTHPKVYVRAAGGGGASGGFLIIRDCITSMVVGDLDVASTGSNALDIDIRSSNLLVRAKYSTATTLSAAGDTFLDAKADKTRLPFNVKDYGATGDGVTNDKAAILACFAAAEAAGAGRVVYFPAGVYDTVTGISLSGYSVQLQGAGAAGAGSTLGGTVIYASAQTGPVIDYTGYVIPTLFKSKTRHGGFHVRGSGVADATKAKSGVRLTIMSSAHFYDIAVRDTGGPCWEHMSSPGNAVYLSDFDGLVFFTPVSAKTNDVPYFIGNESNGNRFRGFGFRSTSSSADVGVSGAAILDCNASFPSTFNQLDGWWFENLHIPSGGTIVNIKGNGNSINDPQFFDCLKEAAATGTSFIRFTPPTTNDFGGNVLRGVIPGSEATGADMGVDMRQSRNSVVGVKGYKGTNVVIASGVGATFVQLGGSISGATDAGVVDNSGLLTNVWRDAINDTEYRGGALRRPTRYGTGTPEGVVTATVGETFQRTDGAAGTTLYSKVTGSGNTGWVALPDSSTALAKASNLSDLASASTARTNLGLGTAATTATTAYDAAGAASTAQTAATTAAATAANLAIGPRHRVWTAGRYYGVEGPYAPGTISNGDGLMTAIPFYVHVSNTITSIGAEVTTAAGAGALRFGIYGSNANDQPSGAPLLDSLLAAAATSTGPHESPISLALTPGLYWLAVVPQGGAPTIRTIGLNAQPPVSTSTVTGSTGTAGANCYYMTGVSGSLPTWSGLNDGGQGYRVVVKAS